MKDTDWGLWREALKATSLGWDLALPIFGGVLLGYALDQALGTTYVFTIGLLMLGAFSGFYNVIRFIQRVDEQEQRRAPRKKQGTEEQER